MPIIKEPMTGHCSECKEPKLPSDFNLNSSTGKPHQFCRKCETNKRQAYLSGKYKRCFICKRTLEVEKFTKTITPKGRDSYSRECLECVPDQKEYKKKKHKLSISRYRQSEKGKARLAAKRQEKVAHKPTLDVTEATTDTTNAQL